MLGHLQRGGSPTTFDRVLCSMFGAAAVELIAAGDYGKMVAFTGQHVGSVPIADAVGRLKTVPPTAIWRGRRAPSGCPSAIEPGAHATFKIERLTPFHRSGGRQTAAFLNQIEECGSLPRSRYAGLVEVFLGVS